MSFVSCGCALPEKSFRSPKPVAISPAPLSGGRFISLCSGLPAVARRVAGERRLVGAEGFEPSNTGSKDPRLTTWPRPSSSWITLDAARGDPEHVEGSVGNRPPVLLETLSVDEVTDDRQIRPFTLPGARFPVRVQVRFGVRRSACRYKESANVSASSTVLIRRKRRPSASRRRKRPTARVNGTADR